MSRRFIAALVVASILVFGVVCGQLWLHRTASDLAERSDEVCEIFGAENVEDGNRKLNELSQEFAVRKKILLLFINDARIHEITRSLERAKRLAEEEDLSPALEALSDFSSSLRELAVTHVPTIGNIF